MTLYLKAKSEAAMKKALSAVLPGFVGVDDDGEAMLSCYRHDWSVDWDVPVVAVPAVIALDGTVTTPAIMEPGFFANVIVNDPDIDTSSLDAMSKTPDNPQRVFG